MIDAIAKLLDAAESEKPTKELAEKLQSATVEVAEQIASETKKKDQFWAAATDIRADAKTRQAAKDAHSDSTFLIATLESASEELAKALKRVEGAIRVVAREEARRMIESQRQGITKRVLAEWGQHVDQIAEMISLIKAMESATQRHNQLFDDNLPPMETLIRATFYGGGGAYPAQQSTPLRVVDVQRVHPLNPLRGGY